jgi:hypothetical protein
MSETAIAKRRRFNSLNKPKARQGLSSRVVLAIEQMVYKGLTRKEAAAAVGMSDDGLYRAFRNPQVRRYFTAEVDALKTAERARNVHTGIEIRDDREQPGKTRIDAAKFLEGVTDGPSINLNVGVGIQVTPGYTVKVGDDSKIREIMQHAGSSLNILDLQKNGETPRDGEGTD